MFKLRAFTLVELLVVIAIVGLLSTVVLIATQSISEQGRIAKSLQFSKHLENSLGAYLVGRWSFDEEINFCGVNKVCDTSGWNNHGTAYNFTSPYGFVLDTPSGQGKALSFDVTDDYISIADSASLKFGTTIEFTISFWIKTTLTWTQPPTYRGVIFKSGSLPGVWWGIGYLPNGSFNFDIKDGTTQKSINSGGTFNDDKWHYVVATADKDKKIRIYVDGESKGVPNDISTIVNIDNDGVLRIGIWNGYINALIDEVAIYSAALTFSQIQSEYHVGLGNLLAKGLASEKEYRSRLFD